MDFGLVIILFGLTLLLFALSNYVGSHLPWLQDKPEEPSLESKANHIWKLEEELGYVTFPAFGFNPPEEPPKTRADIGDQLFGPALIDMSNNCYPLRADQMNFAHPGPSHNCVKCQEMIANQTIHLSEHQTMNAFGVPPHIIHGTRETGYS